MSTLLPILSACSSRGHQTLTATAVNCPFLGNFQANNTLRCSHCFFFCNMCLINVLMTRVDEIWLAKTFGLLRICSMMQQSTMLVTLCCTPTLSVPWVSRCVQHILETSSEQRDHLKALRWQTKIVRKNQNQPHSYTWRAAPTERETRDESRTASVSERERTTSTDTGHKKDGSELPPNIVTQLKR